jgi:two-component system CheB/CheR fusion protein
MRTLEIPTGPPVKPSPTLLLQRALLERYGPPTVVVDRSDQVVYFHGATDSFLRQPAGEPTRDLLQLVRPQLRLVVRSVIRNAVRDNRVFTAQADLGESPFPARQVEITCEPVIQGKAPEYFLVSFRLIAGRAEGGEEASPSKPLSPEQAQCEAGVIEEAEALRRELQSTVEAFEATSEELKASNEEATSINEELQSTNEELETGKEELQSVNEELTTVNSQLQTKIAQLEAMTNDLANLLGSTDIAVIFLDADFRVRRYTPAVSDLLELIESDIGRPITDLAPKFTDEHLLTDARQVLQRLIPLEREVRSRSGRWYLRRTLPYRTSENRIEGVVITFVDVGARKLAERATVMAHDRGLAVLDQVPMAILLIDAKDSSLQFANRRAVQLFGTMLPNPMPENETTPVPSVEGVGKDGWRYWPEDWPLARVLATGTSITDEKIRTMGANGRQLTLFASAAPIRDEEGNTVAFVGTFLEVTGKKDG